MISKAQSVGLLQQNENDNNVDDGKVSFDDTNETNNVHFTHYNLSNDINTQVDVIKDGVDDREFAVDNNQKSQSAKTDAVSLAAIKLQKKIGIKHVLRQRSR